MPDKFNRREFLIRAGKYSVYSALALNFGCTVSKVIESEPEIIETEPKSVAVLYGTKYGSTGDTARWICEGIGNTSVPIDVETAFFPNIISQYDYFVIGSGVWTDGVHPELLDLLSMYKADVEGRIIASFIVCGTYPGTLSGKERI